MTIHKTSPEDPLNKVSPLLIVKKKANNKKKQKMHRKLCYTNFKNIGKAP